MSDGEVQAFLARYRFDLSHAMAQVGPRPGVPVTPAIASTCLFLTLCVYLFLLFTCIICLVLANVLSVGSCCAVINDFLHSCGTQLDYFVESVRQCVMPGDQVKFVLAALDQEDNFYEDADVVHIFIPRST